MNKITAKEKQEIRYIGYAVVCGVLTFFLSWIGLGAALVIIAYLLFLVNVNLHLLGKRLGNARKTRNRNP